VSRNPTFKDDEWIDELAPETKSSVPGHRAPRLGCRLDRADYGSMDRPASHSWQVNEIAFVFVQIRQNVQIIIREKKKKGKFIY